MVGNEDLKSSSDPVFYVYIHGIPCLGWKPGDNSTHTCTESPQGSTSTRIHLHRGSTSTRIIPTTFILWPFPVSPGGSEPLGQLKAPVDLSLHLQLNSSREVKLAQSFIRPFLIKKMKRKVQAKYWGLQAKRETCRENPNPASASLQLKVSAQLKQSVCGMVLHSLK